MEAKKKQHYALYAAAGPYESSDLKTPNPVLHWEDGLA